MKRTLILALALAVRRVNAGLYGAFVSRDAAPVKAIDYVLLGAFYIAVLIGILYTQNKITAIGTGKQIII